MPDPGQLRPNAIDGFEIVFVGADDGRTRMTDDVGEVVDAEAIVDRHQHRADLRDGIERFKLCVGVRRDVGDTVARSDAESLQRRGPAIAAGEELLVRQPKIAVDDRLAIGIQGSCTACEFKRRERHFHINLTNRQRGFCFPSEMRFASSWYAPSVPAGNCRHRPSPT